MINKKRLIAAYILAPLIPTLFMLVLPKFFGAEYTGIYTTFMIVIFSLPLSYLSCLIGGGFLIRILSKIDMLSLPAMVTGGFILGAVVWYLFGFLFAAFLSTSKDAMPSLSELLWGAGFGVSVFLPFGIIAGIPWMKKTPGKS